MVAITSFIATSSASFWRGNQVDGLPRRLTCNLGMGNWAMNCARQKNKHGTHNYFFLKIFSGRLNFALNTYLGIEKLYWILLVSCSDYSSGESSGGATVSFFCHFFCKKYFSYSYLMIFEHYISLHYFLLHKLNQVDGWSRHLTHSVREELVSFFWKLTFVFFCIQFLLVS